jgi:hypothetical protein
MANVLILKGVDHGFIGSVMVSVLVSKVVDRGLIGGVFRQKHTNLPPMNP